MQGNLHMMNQAEISFYFSFFGLEACWQHRPGVSFLANRHANENKPLHGVVMKCQTQFKWQIKGYDKAPCWSLMKRVEKKIDGDGPG